MLDDDRPLSPGSRSRPIEQVHEGMRVFDATNQEIGKVEYLRFGDPEAVTTQGEEYLGDTGVAAAPVLSPASGTGSAAGQPVGVVFPFSGNAAEPDVPEPKRSQLLRHGFLKVNGKGLAGLGGHDYYLPAEQIREVAGDQVRLSVPRDDLIRKP